MPESRKRTRERNLAKLAARRQAERMSATRRRNRIIAASAGIVTALVVFALGINLVGDKTKPSASPTKSVSPTPSQKPGTKTGTVKLAATLPKKVACGATAPKVATTAKPQFTAPAQKIDKKANYTATIQTTCGTIVAELFPKQAPIAVNSFVFLAQHHLYPGTWFHRIAKGFVIQGGDPKGDGGGGPGYAFTIETNPKVKFADAPGLLALANSGKPNTNGSQFFITLAKQPNLDAPNGPYTIFGRVIRGLKVVKRIGRVPTTTNPAIPGEQSQPLQAVYILQVTIKIEKPKPSPAPSPSPS